MVQYFPYITSNVVNYIHQAACSVKVLLFHSERYLYSSVVMLPYFKHHISVDGQLGEDGR